MKDSVHWPLPLQYQSKDKSQMKIFEKAKMRRFETTNNSFFIVLDEDSSIQITDIAEIVAKFIKDKIHDLYKTQMINGA